MEKVDSALILAIAICIVRHKPPEQSLASYILDLREKFPLPSAEIPTRGVPAEQNQWRTRALAFEKENESLKLRLQKYEIELLASKSSSNQTDSSSSSQAPKKKRKVESKAANPNLKQLLDELASGPGLPLLQDSFDILSSFHTLKNANTNGIPEMREFNTETVLIPNVKRSLKALSKLLDPLLFRNESTGPIIARSTCIHVADRFRELLLSLLRSTLPLAPRCTVLPDIIEELCLGILRPVIRGFHLTSARIFEPLSKGGKNKEVEPDVRPSMLRVIQQLLDCLHSLREETREIREFLVLETAREVSSLWGKKNTPEKAKTPNEGLQRLARKDSLWYHCAVINLALEDLPQRSIESNDSNVLSVMAVDILYDLPRLFEEEDPVDVMAQGMILAIVEKAWLKGLCICEEEEGEDAYEENSERTEDHSTVYEFSSSHL